MSFADREMFAYNKEREKKKEKIAKHLADPYNRIKYAYEYMGIDPEIDEKCMKSIYENLSKDIDCECHF